MKILWIILILLGILLLGLAAFFRIDRIAKKYGGYVNRQYEEGVFATELMIPLEN